MGLVQVLAVTHWPGPVRLPQWPWPSPTSNTSTRNFYTLPQTYLYNGIVQRASVCLFVDRLSAPSHSPTGCTAANWGVGRQRRRRSTVGVPSRLCAAECCLTAMKQQWRRCAVSCQPCYLNTARGVTWRHRPRQQSASWLTCRSVGERWKWQLVAIVRQCSCAAVLWLTIEGYDKHQTCIGNATTRLN